MRRSRSIPFTFIHTADWHLGAPKGWGDANTPGSTEWVEDLRNLHEKATETVIYEAINRRVAAVLLAGDMTDLYSNPEPELVARIHSFLWQNVGIPLRDNGIKLVVTPGSHDCKSKEAIDLLLSLARDFPVNVRVLVPENFEKFFKETNFKPSSGLFRDLGPSTTCNSITISCDEVERGKWIELHHLHGRDDNAIYSYHSNPPAYRAFGDRHVRGCENGCYFPGTPLVRSSACDAPTEVGPRYCFLYTVGDVEPKAIKLRVPEVGLLKKPTADKHLWNLTYDYDESGKPITRDYEGRLSDP